MGFSRIKVLKQTEDNCYLIQSMERNITAEWSLEYLNQCDFKVEEKEVVNAKSRD